jgi:tetratricopeptide (TPR) repeat protein
LKFIFMQAAFLIMFSTIWADGNLLKLGLDAEAYMQAHDYDQAASIYEKILRQSLPKWQRALALYDLGTVKLHQKQYKEALHDFQLVPLEEASTPQLIRFFYLNKGIAYLNQAEEFSPHVLFFEFDERLNLYTESITQFNEALKIDCQLQQLENGECQPALDLQQLIVKSKLAIQELKREMRDALIKKEPLLAFVVLSASLQRLSTLVGTSPQNINYQAYLLDEAESLLPLWELVQNVSLKGNQVNEAAAKYHTALRNLQQNDLKEALENFNESLKKIDAVDFGSQEDQLKLILAKYQWMLLEENWTISSLQNLLEEQKKLTEERLKQSNEYLETSLKQLQAGQQAAAEFFLTAAFATVNQLSAAGSDVPLNVLTQAWMQARLTKKLIQLSLIQPMAEAKMIVEKMQKETIIAANAFLPAVLAEEKKLFDSKNPKVQRCQKQPWDQVLPLFDKGYQSALAASQGIEPQQMLLEQSKTLFYWKEALQILSQPPRPQSINLPEQASSNINEILRRIQEMQAQDQPVQEPSYQELHSW